MKPKMHFIIILVIFVCILLIWEIAPKLELVSPLSLPSFSSVMISFWNSICDYSLINRSLLSLQVIGIGFLIGAVLAFGLAGLSAISDGVWSFMKTLIAILDPLPAVALLPLAILWFGVGTNAILFTIVHSVLWPMLLNVYNGFKSVPKTQLEVGRNIGLSKFEIVTKVMMPSAFKDIIVGLKVGWSRSWRALVAGEMVFGATGASGGLGWYIYQKRFFMDTAGVFAGLIMIAILGIVVEYGLFALLEKNTVKKWGMQTSIV
jgi:NitT/TauT family transport system permease protein